MNIKILALGSCIVLGVLGWMSPPREAEEGGYVSKLSEYGFFHGEMADMLPSEGVIPYELNTPLFSDYALKARFIRIPTGKTVAYNDSLVFDFPVGTEIVKTFYYPKDARNVDKGRRLIETRVLIREEAGWKALPYVWDEAQGEAYLEVAGARKEVQWKDNKGKKQKIDYVVPNMNQCKGCHLYGESLSPIGPSARQLHRELSYPHSETHNQLQYMADKGWLTGLPDLEKVPQPSQLDSS